MKVNVEVDCTPEEMRRFLGLPDVSDLNKSYIDTMQQTMAGETNMEQVQKIMKNVAPMGEMGLRFFQTIMENAAASGMGKSHSDKDKKTD